MNHPRVSVEFIRSNGTTFWSGVDNTAPMYWSVPEANMASPGVDLKMNFQCKTYKRELYLDGTIKYREVTE